MNLFDKHRQQLLQSLDSIHAAFYEAAIFTGPSLHFHLRALETARAAEFELFTESVYALLASWGMHRMGPGGSKMREFKEFTESLRTLWPIILNLQQSTPDDLDANAWQDLNKIFCGMRSMASGTSLVGNSKVMAHALPSLIPPVDRQYTLRFLFGHPNITNDLGREWDKLQLILREFFYPLVGDKSFQTSAARWQDQRTKFRWDTSPLKIADNLIIGHLKVRGKTSA